ncbi:MAG: FG-GAP repeat protein [Planctomycetes bacterium]|nr:FG-GAP repeat protein [Planctomycetota bacterium]
MHRSRRLLASLTLTSIALAPLSAQELVGSQPGDAFGTAVCLVGDVDGDGVDDVAVGAPFATDAQGLRCGVVTVHSGADRSVLARLVGQPGDQYGSALSTAGDVDADGVPDVIVGAPRRAGGRGAVLVISLRSVGTLFEVTGRPGDGLGSAVTGGMDVTGDGFPDFAAGAPTADNGTAVDAGRVVVHSGRDGALVAERFGSAPVDRLGHALAFLADWDGDGRADLAIGAPGADAGGTDAGTTLILDPRRQLELASFDGLQPGDELGFAVAGSSDPRPGPGRAQVAAGAPGAVGGRGQVSLLGEELAGPSVDRLELTGDELDGRFGQAVAALGDADADREHEFAIGAPGLPTGAFPGEVVWVSAAIDAMTATARYVGRAAGTRAGERFASVLCSAGDPDRDGFGDLLAGMPTAGPNGSRAGAVRWLDVDPQRAATWTFSMGEQIGVAVGIVDDLDRDGHPEVLVSSPRGAPSAVQALGDAGLRRTAYQIDSFGTELDPFGDALTGIGDANADGRPDILVAGSGSSPLVNGNRQPAAGGFRIYSSVQSPITVLGTFYGLQPGDRLGTSVAHLDDLDGDGVSDFVVGAPGSGGGSHAGYAQVHSGVQPFALIRVLRGTAIDDAFGASVANAGDVDGDGIGDVLVGAPRGGPRDEGYVRVHSGRDGRQLFTKFGLGADDGFGTATAGLGDLDGDGHAEFAVGAPQSIRSGAARRGYVQVFSGSDGRLLATLAGGASDRLFGRAIAGGGDLDGDGVGDLVVGAPRPTPRGLVHTFSGRTLGPLRSSLELDSAEPDGFGTSVVIVPDIDGDGRAELAAGAPTGGPLSGGFPGSPRQGTIALLRTASRDGRVQRYGIGCVTSLGTLPSIRVDVPPQLGATWEVRLRDARPLALSILLLGSSGRRQLDLGPLGMPGCTAWHAADFGVFPVATDAGGRATATLGPLPTTIELVDAAIWGQWLVDDPFANALQWVLSDAVEANVARN